MFQPNLKSFQVSTTPRFSGWKTCFILRPFFASYEPNGGICFSSRRLGRIWVWTLTTIIFGNLGEIIFEYLRSLMVLGSLDKSLVCCVVVKLTKICVWRGAVLKSGLTKGTQQKKNQMNTSFPAGRPSVHCSESLSFGLHSCAEFSTINSLQTGKTYWTVRRRIPTG